MQSLFYAFFAKKNVVSSKSGPEYAYTSDKTYTKISPFYLQCRG